MQARQQAFNVAVKTQDARCKLVFIAQIEKFHITAKALLVADSDRWISQKFDKIKLSGSLKKQKCIDKLSKSIFILNEFDWQTISIQYHTK